MIGSMFRRVIFWTHLSIGVAAGIAILIMSITGVLLAFERQILQFADRDLRAVNVPAGVRSRSLDEMLATVSASAGSAPSGVLIRPEPSASVEFTFGSDRNVYVDPYTGAVLGEGSKPARQFFAAVERWHRALGAPLSAHGPLRSVAAAANLLFLMLVVSGCGFPANGRGPLFAPLSCLGPACAAARATGTGTMSRASGAPCRSC